MSCDMCGCDTDHLSGFTMCETCARKAAKPCVCQEPDTHEPVDFTTACDKAEDPTLFVWRKLYTGSAVKQLFAINGRLSARLFFSGSEVKPSDWPVDSEDVRAKWNISPWPPKVDDEQ